MRVQLRAASHDRGTDRALNVAKPHSDYADVTEMFHVLRTLANPSTAFDRQREAIITRSLPLADHIALRFRNRGEPLEDLVQVARIGLLNAVNRFDVETGSAFLPFAVPTITGEIRRHFRDHGWTLKVPRRLKDLNMQLNKATAELSQVLGRTPTATEVANHLGVDRELVVEGLVASTAYSALSTDAPARAGDARETVGHAFGDIDANLDKVLDIETVRPILATLPKREQTVLGLRFFDNMTQTQIAERLGISQMHVSRLLAHALSTLRDQVESLEHV
jgi:RNA polymerase sigma-B factor